MGSVTVSSLLLICCCSWTSSRLGVFAFPQAHHVQETQTIVGRKLSATSTVLFLAQKKKPRFSQKAHISQRQQQEQQRQHQRSPADGSPSSFGGTRRSSTSSYRNGKRQPWQSGKSIDELESIMTKRWGNMDDASSSFAGIPKGFELAEEDSRNDDDETSATIWRRPVVDPWEKEAAKSKAKKNGKFEQQRPPAVREYYDHDDEGFEYLDDDDDDETNGNILQVKHLIAPKPAGGRGTSAPPATKGGSYFFNPNAASNAQKQIQQKNDSRLQSSSSSSSVSKEYNRNQNFQNDDTTTETTSSRSTTKRDRAPPAKPLLDDDGNPRLLTVDEAIRCFQDTVDEGTMEIIETAEVPILACTNAQSWEDLGITSEILLENLEYMNCPTPLAVQEKTTPAILTGSDVLVGTYTGSGKTLAFLAPLAQRLLWSMDDKDPGLAVLIVAPGRELASQIVSVARELLQDTGLTAQLAIGGTTFSRNLEQIRKRKPNIVVGTPGRIAELVVGKPGEKSGKLKVGSLQSLVMDEFDALLEYKPHRDPTRAIMQSLKRRHGDTLQSILCSATASDIMDSSKVVDFLRPGYETAMADDDDVLVTDGKGSSEKSTTSAPQVSRTVLHGVVHLPHRRFALEAVRRILHTEPIPQQILIFVENARKVDIVVEKLADRGIIAAPLHGGTGSEKMDRAEVSRALREGYVGIVVATELAARGLDAPLLTHVINLDLPTDASHYAHRAGRCGRGGRPGVVINITTSPKEKNVPKRFANELGVEMFSAEPRGGKLLILDPETQSIEY